MNKTDFIENLQVRFNVGSKRMLSGLTKQEQNILLKILETKPDLDAFEQSIREDCAKEIHSLKIHYIQNDYPKLNGDKYLIACDDCKKTIRSKI